MAKRYILILILLSFSAVGIYFIRNAQIKREVGEQKKQYLSNIKIRSLQDSSVLTLPEDKASVIVYFNSECGGCHYQVLNTWKNLEQFKAAQVFLISAETSDVLLDFFEANKIYEKVNVGFGRIEPEDVYETFGSVSIPDIFIYDKDHKLIKEFKGTTKIETILKHLP